MKAVMNAGLLAWALWPAAVAAQEKLALEAGSAEVIAHIRAHGLDRDGLTTAVSVLTQRFESVDRAELDALANELVALIVAADDESTSDNRSQAANAGLALVLSTLRDRDGGVPYLGAYDAMLRAYVMRSQAGKGVSMQLYDLARIDPVRASGLVRDLFTAGHREACDAAQFGEFPFDIEAGLRPGYASDLCAGRTHLRTKRFLYWPRGSRSFVGIGLQHGERWQAHHVAARPYPVVHSVYPCSPAHYAGLRVGDVLTAVNGRDAREDIPVGEFGEPGGEATVRHDRGEPGSGYELEVERDGSVMMVAMVSVDRREWVAADPARPLASVTGTPTDEGCPAVPWWSDQGPAPAALDDSTRTRENPFPPSCHPTCRSRPGATSPEATNHRKESTTMTTTMTAPAPSVTRRYLDEAERYSAHNYHPLPVVLDRGEGVWVWDVEGNRYLDMLASYSAVNQGHRHPEIVAAAREQMDRLTLTSRAFHNDRMGPFLRELCEAAGFDAALPMNTGAEAVETAIKMVRKWGYESRGVPDGQAEIIVCEDNFHGRTTTIVGFSSEEQYRAGFGPFTPGFRIIPYGDIDALRAAIGPNTVGFLVEPIQGEAGVIVPPDGYMRDAAELCRENGVALVADEIQTGLGRTGRFMCCDWEGVRPDVLIVGKALGGGVYPVSAAIADSEFMDVFRPGDHGSTFGGNPLGAAVGIASLRVIIEEDLSRRSDELGSWFMDRLRAIPSPHVAEVRGRGLMIGVVIKESSGTARPFCEALQTRGILAKETHRQVVRFAPPLTVTRAELEDALVEIEAVLR